MPGRCLCVQTVRKHFKMGVMWCRESWVLWSYSSAFRSDTLSKNVLRFKEKKHTRNGSEFELLFSFVPYTMAIHMLLSIELKFNFQWNTILFDILTIKINYASRSWITHFNDVVSNLSYAHLLRLEWVFDFIILPKHIHITECITQIKVFN